MLDYHLLSTDARHLYLVGEIVLWLQRFNAIKQEPDGEKKVALVVWLVLLLHYFQGFRHDI